MSKVEGLDKELDLWVEVFLEHSCKVVTENHHEMTYSRIGQLIDLFKEEVEMFKRNNIHFCITKIKYHDFIKERGYLCHGINYEFQDGPKVRSNYLEIHTDKLTNEQIKMLHDSIKTVCSI